MSGRTDEWLIKRWHVFNRLLIISGDLMLCDLRAFNGRLSGSICVAGSMRFKGMTMMMMMINKF